MMTSSSMGGQQRTGSSMGGQQVMGGQQRMTKESTDYFEQSKMGGLQVMRESSGPSNFKMTVTKPSSDGKSKTYG